SRTIDAADEAILALTATRPRLVIANKSDLPSAIGDRLPIDCACSALTGAGLGAVQDRLKGWVTNRTGTDGEEGGIVAGRRVLEHLGIARERIGEAERRLEDVPFEAVLIDLLIALMHLDRILGIDVDEAVLDRIFATFCVGK